MDVCLFVSLGTRDVQIKNNTDLDENLKKELEELKYPSDNKNFRDLNVRKFGHWLSNKFDLIKEVIEMPLIEPFLRDIEEKGEIIRKIYLIATDQSKTVNENAREHVSRDTCTIARFLKDKYFNYYFRNKNRTIPDVDTIILKNPPNNYDLVIKEFEDRLREIVQTDNKNYMVYAEITGGTPQINTSVILNCTKFYRDKVSFIYKSENSEEVKVLNISDYLLKTYEHEALIKLVNRYDFDAIVQNESDCSPIGKLAQFACYRMNFDFFNYKKIIGSRFDNIPNEMGVKSLREDAFKLIGKEPESLFNELYWNAVVMWQRDECANFIGRLWRIMEASLQYCLLEIIGSNWDDMVEHKETGKENFVKKFEIWAENNHPFLTYLENHKKDYSLSHIRKPISPNMPILHASIDFLAQKQSKYKDVQEWAKKLRPFGNMRNKSIIAHGFEGISKEKILKMLENEEDKILLIVRNFIESVGISLSEENPFNLFKDIIIEMSEKRLIETLNV